MKTHPAPKKATNNEPNNKMSWEEDEPTPGDPAAAGSPGVAVTSMTNKNTKG